MKKVWIAIVGFILLMGTWIFFMINQGLCENNSCATTQTQQTTGIIMSFSEENLYQAQLRNDRIGIFFEASRCSNCKLIHEELQKKGIPENATLLTVDFDNFDLKKQYQVQNLHTLVIIDKNWEVIAKDASGDYETFYQLLKK